MKLNRVILLLLTAAWIVFFAVIRKDPFYGDAISSVSRVSLLIFDSNFSSLHYPVGFDPGHPILIPIIHALFWKMFGCSLAISHLINLTFSIGTLFVVYNWLKVEGGDSPSLIGVCLLSITPLFLAQSAMLNTHLPLTFLFTLAAYHLNGLLGKTEGDKRNWFYFILASSLMMLVHLQSVFYLFSLCLWFILRRSSINKNNIGLAFRLFVPAAIIFALWVIYHYSLSGWALSSPDYAAHRGSPGLKRVLVNLVLADWRIVDYGQVAFFVVPIILLFKGKFKIKSDSIFTLFLLSYLLNAVLIATTTTTGPAHRYFLPTLPFLVMACSLELGKLSKTWTVLVVAVLVSGHFWFYPGKIIGDATMQYRSTFKLLEEVRKTTGEEPVYSFAPLGNQSRSMYLKEGESDLKSLYETEPSSVRYILYGNVSGDFSSDLLTTLNENWHGKSFQHGRVWLNLYLNPQFASKPEDWNLREKTSAEKWMENLKKKMNR